MILTLKLYSKYVIFAGIIYVVSLKNLLLKENLEGRKIVPKVCCKLPLQLLRRGSSDQDLTKY